MLLIGQLATNFSEILLIEINTFPFKNMHLKIMYGKWRPFCLSLNMLKQFACLLMVAEHKPCLNAPKCFASTQGMKFDPNNQSCIFFCWIIYLQHIKNGHYFTDEIFKCIFLKEKCGWYTSLNHISKGAIENKHWSMKWFEQCYDAVYLIIRPNNEDFVTRSRYLRQG